MTISRRSHELGQVAERFRDDSPEYQADIYKPIREFERSHRNRNSDLVAKHEDMEIIIENMMKRLALFKK